MSQQTILTILLSAMINILLILIFYRFKFKTVTSGEFKDFFLVQFADSVSSVSDIDWETWFHVPGLPSVALQADFTNSLSHDAVALAIEWLDVEISGASVDSKDFIIATSIEVRHNYSVLRLAFSPLVFILNLNN